MPKVALKDVNAYLDEALDQLSKRPNSVDEIGEARQQVYSLSPAPQPNQSLSPIAPTDSRLQLCFGHKMCQHCDRSIQPCPCPSLA